MKSYILTPPLLAAYLLFKHWHLLRVVYEEECAGIDATVVGAHVCAVEVIAHHVTILFVADRLGTISIGIFFT